MTLRPAALAAAVLLAATLAACSSDESDPAAEPTPTPASSAPTSTGSPGDSGTTPAPTEPPAEVPAGVSLVVRIDGESVSPNAADLDLGRGEPLTLRITSDRAGELHVHSRPEQYVEFEAGASTHELVIDAPGSVEVEEHESGVVVAVLKVGG
ncbi:hypothetical protein [Nocardioides sp. W7]|uniref:hypothetical protein n=1 Tax=Nocardioides sp. W7 TaxID=2931390 RepID=UPI001FD2C2A0|nr:hypothetical protein [Nocardioides sp. W7]